MTYGQVDPARLDGDALTRWYLRSPADIEQERQTAAARAYDDFFSSRPAPSNGDQYGNPAASTSDYQPPAAGSDQVPSDNPRSAWEWGDASPDLAQFDPASATQVAANGWICAGCHGTGISPPPPTLSTPWATPWRPASNLAPRRPAKPAPPQCSMQNMNDSRICSREPNDAWKSVCLGSASEREAYCISHDGEIGWPPLETHDRR